MNRKHLGSTLDRFLEKDETLAEVRAAAVKRAFAYQIEQARKRARVSKATMATRMGTSRSAVDRLLDPANSAVTLDTLARAAWAVGRRLKVELG
jgi:hypothetical protein